MRGWTSRFTVENLLSQITENIHWELFGASKKIWLRKICIDERRGYDVFPSSTFESQYRKLFRELFGVSEISWYGMKYMDKTGLSQASVIFLVSFYWKTSLGTLRCFKKFSVCENIARIREGDITFFRRNFSVPQFRNFSLGTLRCEKKTSGNETFLRIQGRCHVFRQTVFVSGFPKISLGTLRCFRNF